MRFQVRMETTDDGEYVAECEQMGATGRGMGPQNALDRLRAELRYRLEICPCSSVDDDFIELDCL